MEEIKMKRNQWKAFFSLSLSVLLLTGCAENEPLSTTHTHQFVVTKTEPTCLTAGSSSYTCNCGEHYTEPLEALGHTPGEWEIVKDATKTESGLKSKKCSACGEKSAEEIIPATGSLGLKFVSNGDGTCYVTSLGNCNDMDVVVPSEYNGERVVAVHSAFQNAAHLTSVSLPDSVTSIGVQAFATCLSLKTVSLGNGVTNIADYAFMQCQNLDTVIIPESVTRIGFGIFAFCPKLTTIQYSGTVKQWNAIAKNSNWNHNLSATQVICSDGTVSLT